MMDWIIFVYQVVVRLMIKLLFVKIQEKQKSCDIVLLTYGFTPVLS